MIFIDPADADCRSASAKFFIPIELPVISNEVTDLFFSFTLFRPTGRNLFINIFNRLRPMFKMMIPLGELVVVFYLNPILKF